MSNYNFPSRVEFLESQVVSHLRDTKNRVTHHINLLACHNDKDRLDSLGNDKMSLHSIRSEMREMLDSIEKHGMKLSKKSPVGFISAYIKADYSIDMATLKPIAKFITEVTHKQCIVCKQSYRNNAHYLIIVEEI